MRRLICTFIRRLVMPGSSLLLAEKSAAVRQSAPVAGSVDLPST